MEAQQQQQQPQSAVAAAAVAAAAVGRCRIRRCERVGGDPDRFYCPYPGCNRSFIDLWRLKVHYRAASDVRGSGRERGHGLELPACPKCGKVLERGRHHVNCAAGKAAPSQASRREHRAGAGGGGGGVGGQTKSLKRKAVGPPEGRERKALLAPARELQISLDSAVRVAAAAAAAAAAGGPTTTAPSTTSSVPGPEQQQQHQVENNNSLNTTANKMTTTTSNRGVSGLVHNIECSQANAVLKSSLASRRPCGLTISPVETPMFEGQLDSRDSVFSTDTYAGLSPIPISLPVASNTAPTGTGGRISIGSPSGRQQASNVNVVAMPAQSITPRGPGPLNLSDCHVTQGYAVFVEGNEARYDVFFVPEGSQDPCNIQVDLETIIEEK